VGEKMNTEFKVGDRVKIIGEYDSQNNEIGDGLITLIENNTTVGYMMYCFKNGYFNCYRNKDLQLIDTLYSQTPLKEILKTTEATMELKDINKQNLAEAKRQVEQEKTNAEIEFARAEYRRLVDKRDEFARSIKQYQEMLDEVNEKLKIFRSKQ
jgi:hypothetical protein